MSKARAAREDAERIERERRGREPKPGQRLLVISACCECVHSRESSACFHPKTPGRTDRDGRAPFNDGSTHDVLCSRALPPVPPGRGGFPEYQTPPDWCPLPLALTEPRP
jgi:hypothetical protein